MRSSVVKIALVAAAGLSLAACQSAKDSFGLSKVTPDEFRVVTKAPLVVPADFNMHAPVPGQPRPQEQLPETAARMALMGASAGADRSEGEKLLVQRAGGDHADPNAHYAVDDNFGEVAYKDKSFADKVLFWRKEGAQTSNAAGATQREALNVQAEQARLKALTGGKSVIIAKKTDKRKLPGL